MVEALNEAFHVELARDDAVMVMGEDVGRSGGVLSLEAGLLLAVIHHFAWKGFALLAFTWFHWCVEAVAMLLLVVQLLFGPKLGYARWAAIFSQQWMRFATFVVVVALAWHAWVGMRDILMDYVRATGLRLALQCGVALMLLFYLVWSASILWTGIPR